MGKNTKKKSGWDDIDGGMGFVIPVSMLRCSNFARLTPYGCKLVFDLARQYSGFNNGYLCASWSLMQSRGWRSPATLYKAVRELEHYQIIFRTQQGGLNKPNLHAFTWRSINEKAGKEIDVKPSPPSNAWKFDQPNFEITFGIEGRRPPRELRKAA